MKLYLTQYQWGRRLYGGIYYLINPVGLPMAPFWSERVITSCQSRVEKVEKVEKVEEY